MEVVLVGVEGREVAAASLPPMPMNDCGQKSSESGREGSEAGSFSDPAFPVKASLTNYEAVGSTVSRRDRVMGNDINHACVCVCVRVCKCVSTE